MNGLIGCKLGMTRIFTKYGNLIPVSVIEILENRIVQIKNFSNDGYYAIQLTTGFKKKKNITKSLIGHFEKFKINYGRGLWEFRCLNNDKFFVGQTFYVNFFKEIKKVDIIGISKGKGFSGTVKRWNFKTQDATHGNSLSHRAPGSIGQNQTPGRVFKNKKMAGHLGCERVTVQNLNVVKINLKYNLLIVKGSIPGFIGNNIIVKPSVKYLN